MRLYRLGNGSALNPKKTNSSFMVFGDKANMLIDCGYNVYQKLEAEYKVNDKLKYIFITHMDDDHIGSLRALMYDLYFKHKTIPTILCCDDVYDRLKVYLEDHTGVMKNYNKEPEILFNMVSLINDRPYNIDLNNYTDFTIKTFENKHFQSGSGISMFNYATHNGISITSDTIPCENIAEEFELMTTRCKKYTMFHDYSNWNEPAMQVHACSDSIIKCYQPKMVSRLKFYHNDAIVNKKTIEF